MSTFYISIFYISTFLHYSGSPDPMVGVGLEPLFPQRTRAMFSPLTKPILASPPLFHKHSNPLLYYYTINYKANVFCPWGFSALEVFHWATQYAENCLRTHPKQRPYLAHLSISTIFAWKGCIKNSNGKWGLTNQSSLETSVFCCLFAAVKYRLGQCLAIWDLPALSPGFNPPTLDPHTSSTPTMAHCHP